MISKFLPNGFVLGAFVKDNEMAKGMVIGSRHPGDATTKGVIMLMCDNDNKTHLIINQDLLQELNGEIILKTYNEAYPPAGFDGETFTGVFRKVPLNPNRVEDMDTLKQRDDLLRKAFLDLADIPMDPETELLEEPFLHFPAGTNREDIWKWFDERYSKGVVDLLYLEGIDHHPELEKLFHRRACCFECDSEKCAYNPEGVCMYPVLYGTVPEYVDEEGCQGFLYKEPQPVPHKSHDAVMMEDFNRRKPVGAPTSRAYWFTAEFTKGSQCVNDLLRAYLKDHGIWYTNTVSGEVWFQYQGEWRKCEQEVDGNSVRFYMQEFEMG